MVDWKSLGFTLYEGRILEATLSKERTVKELLRITRIPAGKIYSVIRGLSRAGVVTCTDTRPMHVRVDDPHAFAKRTLARKRTADDAIAEELRSHVQRIPPVARDTGMLQVGVTLEQNRALQSRVFTQARREVLQVLGPHHRPSSNRRQKDAWERQIRDAIDRGVRFRCIYPAGAVVPRALDALRGPRFQIRYLATAFPRCDIVDRERVMLKITHEDPLLFGGIVLLEHDLLARHLSGVFARLWAEASEHPGSISRRP